MARLRRRCCHRRRRLPLPEPIDRVDGRTGRNRHQCGDLSPYLAPRPPGNAVDPRRGRLSPRPPGHQTAALCCDRNRRAQPRRRGRADLRPRLRHRASALSTVIAQWVGAMAYLVWIARAIAEHGVGLGPDWRIIGRLAGAGPISSFALPLCEAVSPSPSLSQPDSAMLIWPPTRSRSRSGRPSPLRSMPWRSQRKR